MTYIGLSKYASITYSVLLLISFISAAWLLTTEIDAAARNLAGSCVFLEVMQFEHI